MKYIILHSNFYDHLEKLVNQKIKYGFKPLGGITYAFDLYNDYRYNDVFYTTRHNFYQVMIKE